MTVSCIPNIDMAFCYLNIPATDLRCVKLSAIWDKMPYHIRGVGHLLNPVGATSRAPRLMDLIPPLSCYMLFLLFLCS